jgi:hypothetical protein
MFVGQEKVKVGGTKIYAKKWWARQFLVYEAEVESSMQNAMVLPVPVAAPGTYIELMDLSAFDHLFGDLLYYYVPPPPRTGMPAFGPPQLTLDVVRVGSYEASIVPTLGDMVRLDARFHLSPALKDTLASRYGDHAFVVYQFAAGKQKLHPFGFTFESRYDQHLFFPTLHVHDGHSLSTDAWFDHYLFAQRSKLGERYQPLGYISAINRDGTPRFPQFIETLAPLEYERRVGQLPNEDLLVPLDG